jgi:hypothetical protein
MAIKKIFSKFKDEFKYTKTTIKSIIVNEVMKILILLVKKTYLIIRLISK